MLSNAGTTEFGGLRWNSGTSKLRIHDAAGATDISAAPSTGTWVYVFIRGNGTNTEAGWKTIAESDFLTSGHKASQAAYTGGSSANSVRVGANQFQTTCIDGRVFRLSVWDAYVSDADLLTAAATDLGFTTGINTHIPGTATGDPNRYADTSGNSRNWTPGGTTISDGSDPSFGSANDLAGAAVAGATGSATIIVQRNLATTAVAGALSTGALSVNKALTGAAIAQAVGAAALQVFGLVWRIPTSAPNGTALHVLVMNGSSPSYGILAQGTAIVAGGYIDVPGTGSAGTKAFALVHNYNDNTATTSIRGGPSIATLTSI
jgi:hypothetical protein